VAGTSSVRRRGGGARNSASSRDSTSGKFMSRRGQRKHHAAVSYASCLFRRGVGAEGEPVAADAKLGVKSAVGARSDASKTGRSAAAQRHPDEKEKRWRWR
jgi:hypothetical protein